MDNGANGKCHRLVLDERKSGSVSGVKTVISFDEEEAVLELANKKLILKGRNLQVIKLDVDKGDIEFSGEIYNILYQEIKDAKRVASGLVKRMFG